ncbi:flavodoxin family protein [Nevskia soli]|uniref:flavodoxin family protein n=1 Tax=Nevskia soli TaxID=418856 RepID=UPI0009FCD0DC|nr:flavodoxin [Nevskia soli]
MSKSNILVVYYSRSGTTREVAEALASALGCDIEEITDVRDRSGRIGYLRSLIAALRQRPSVIAPTTKDPSGYQLVIIGTPVWAGSVSSPVRAYLLKYASRLRSAAFFCTLGGRGAESTFAQMEKLIGQAPHACLSITAYEVAAHTFGPRVNELARTLRNGIPPVELPPTAEKATGTALR